MSESRTPEQKRAPAEEQTHDLSETPQWTDTARQAIEEGRPVTYRNGGRQTTLAVPVSYADELIGLLGFSADEMAEWDEADLRAVEAIAEQVGLALENQRLFDQTQAALAETERQARRLAQLNEIGAYLSAARFLEDVVAIVHRQTNELLGGQWVGMVLIDPVSGELAAFDRDEQALTHQPEPDHTLGGSAVERALETRRLQVDDDLERSDHAHDRRLTEIGVVSRLVAPLLGQTGVLGALTVAAGHPGAFTENDRNLLQQLAALVAATVENLRLAEATRTRASQLERLSEVEAALSQARSEEGVVEALTLVSAQAQRITLYYLETNEQDVPVRQMLRSHWDRGRFVERVPARIRVIEMEQTPAAALWIDEPDNPILVEDVSTDPRADEKTRQTSQALDIVSMAVVPLRAGERWQGVVFMTWDKPHIFSETERFVLNRLPETLSAIVARLRATAAQEQALAETAALYDLSARLNAADTVEEVIEAVASVRAAEGGLLLLPEQEPAGSEAPATLRVAAAWTRIDKGTLPLDQRFDRREFDLSWLWSDSEPRPRFTTVFDDTTHAPTGAADVLGRIDAAAIVWLPLRVRRRWLGAIAVTWQNPRPLTARDRRIYGSLMSQAAVVINQLLLLREAQQRAEQLELVAAIETRLSQIQTEEEMLEVMAETLRFPHAISLSDVVLDDAGQPMGVIPRVRWEGKALAADHPALGRQLSLRTVPGWRFWQENPAAIIYGAEAERTEDLSEAEEALCRQFGTASIAALPLLSGGRWQSLLTFSAPEPYDFDETTRFVFERLLEPVAASVASWRAFLAQQLAQRETETLYTASRRINAAGDARDLLVAISEALNAPALQQALLYVLSESDAEEGGQQVSIGAIWSRDETLLALTPGPVRDEQRARALIAVAGSEPQFYRDVVDAGALAPEAVHFVAEHGIRGMVTLPLRAGERQVGVVLLYGREPLAVDERLRRIATSLAPQVAVAFENRELLQQSELRARRERTLREITARVRGVTNVDTILRTAAREVGRALGREAYVYLEPARTDDEPAGTERTTDA